MGPAAEYSIPERAVGSAREPAYSMRNPLNTRLFGNPAVGAVTGVIGAAYGGTRGAYEALGGDDYIPGRKQAMRRQTEKPGRYQYYRSKRLYDATGAKRYEQQMMETSVG